MSMHFASQAEADQYVVERQMSSKRRLRVTPARRAYFDKMEERRDSYAAPVYKLPDDILAEVFKVGALVDGRMNVAFAFKVSHVVSRWRRVALGYPALWTTLAVTLSDDAARQLQLANLLFQRSSPLPIQLEIKLAFHASLFEMPVIEFPSPTYGPVFQRCNAMTIIGQSVIIVHLHDAAPFLSSLASLELNKVHFPSPSSLVTVLQGMPSLYRLSVTDCSLTKVLHDVPGVAVLTELASLIYVQGAHMLRPLSLTELLGLIHTPGLRDFRCECMIPTPDVTILSRSNLSAVRIVDFRKSWASPMHLLGTLEGMPALEVLTLRVELRIAMPELAPAPLSFPSLIEVEFHDTCACLAHTLAELPCTCFDRLARFLITQTAASPKCFRFSQELRALSEETKAWIREHVPQTLA